MKGDFLQRRLMGTKKYGSDLIFYLPLNENTQAARTDQISGNVIEAGPSNTLIWDSTTKMYKYTSNSTLNNYCFRIKTGWFANLFDTYGSYTVVAKCKLSTSTQKYASFIALKPSGSSNFNKNYSAIQCLNLLGSGNTSNTNNYLSYQGIYATSANTTVRNHIINDVLESRDAATGYNMQYIFTSGTQYDGYLYFGANFDNTWQYNITYYLSELMIFNRILTQEEIFDIQSINVSYPELTLASGSSSITLDHNVTSKNLQYTATVNVNTYLGNQTFTHTGTSPIREYSYSGNGSTTWAANTSTTSTLTYSNKSVTFDLYPTFVRVLRLTVILKKVPPSSYYTISTDEWEKVALPSSLSSTNYDGVWRSASNYNVNNSFATMWINVFGYSSFKFYIRSYAESNYDYVMVSNPGYGITNSTSYSDTTFVYAHTRGKQNSNTSLDGYTEVSFNFNFTDYISNSDGSYTIQVIYRKDSSQHSNDDRGYVIIPKNQ